MCNQQSMSVGSSFTCFDGAESRTCYAQEQTWDYNQAYLTWTSQNVEIETNSRSNRNKSHYPSSTIFGSYLTFAEFPVFSWNSITAFALEIIPCAYEKTQDCFLTNDAIVPCHCIMIVHWFLRKSPCLTLCQSSYCAPSCASWKWSLPDPFVSLHHLLWPDGFLECHVFLHVRYNIVHPAVNLPRTVLWDILNFLLCPVRHVIDEDTRLSELTAASTPALVSDSDLSLVSGIICSQHDRLTERLEAVEQSVGQYAHDHIKTTSAWAWAFEFIRRTTVEFNSHEFNSFRTPYPCGDDRKCVLDEFNSSDKFNPI